MSPTIVAPVARSFDPVRLCLRIGRRLFSRLCRLQAGSVWPGPDSNLSGSTLFPAGPSAVDRAAGPAVWSPDSVPSPFAAGPVDPI